MHAGYWYWDWEGMSEDEGSAKVSDMLRVYTRRKSGGPLLYQHEHQSPSKAGTIIQ